MRLELSNSLFGLGIRLVWHAEKLSVLRLRKPVRPYLRIMSATGSDAVSVKDHQYFEEQILDGGSDRCRTGGCVLVADRARGAARHGQVGVRDHPLQPPEGGHLRGPVAVCGQIRWVLAMAQADGQGNVTFSDQVRPTERFSGHLLFVADKR